MDAVLSPAVSCPVCSSEAVHAVLRVKDHSVSGEYFNILECSRCSLRFTAGVPDREHIGRYYQSENYISHSNTRKGLVNALYHRVRAHTLRSKYRLIRSLTGMEQGKHLDIGAGTGAFVRQMRARGWQSEGIEPDETARAVALRDHRISLLPAGALPRFSAQTFDAVSLWHVLEHVHDLYPYLDQIKKIMKPAGKLFIAVPNYLSYDGMKYRENWAAYDVPRHLYHFSPASMKYLLDNSGFRLTGMKPMWFDSFYISLLSEQYARGRVSLFRGFLSGAVSDAKALLDKERWSSLIYAGEPIG
jgi:SAM-dependent methyltransferase